MIEPLWLSLQEVIDANRRVVAETGEPFLLRDKGLLESALTRPRNRFLYDGVDDVTELAATLLIGVGRNHPFMQGNKRTAFATAVMFLRLNGYRLLAEEDSDSLGRVIEGCIRIGGEDLEGMLAELFRSMVELIEPSGD